MDEKSMEESEMVGKIMDLFDTGIQNHRKFDKKLDGSLTLVTDM